MTRYKLSFTTGGLFTREASITAPLFLELQDWDAVRVALKETNILQHRTSSSGTRVDREVLSRLSTMNDEELDLLTSGTAQERTHLMWVAACRRYALIAEFAEEVMREKFLLLTPQLNLDDFDGFVRAKSLWHEELNTLADSTFRKLRQNLFKMLREAELLSVDGYIVQASLSTRVADLLARRDPAELSFFPLTDADIQRATQ